LTIVPLPEKYRRQLIESHEAAERQARRDTRREWARVLGEIVLWTLLGLVGIGFAFHALDVELGWVYWWASAIVWVAGVSAAVITAYLRGQQRGDWQ
jgi:hypothetical protein